jgi:hypothetical protein
MHDFGIHIFSIFLSTFWIRESSCKLPFPSGHSIPQGRYVQITDSSKMCNVGEAHAHVWGYLVEQIRITFYKRNLRSWISSQLVLAASRTIQSVDKFLSYYMTYHNTIACATSIHLRLFKHITCLEGKSNSQWHPLPQWFSLPSFLPWPHGRPQPTTLALFKTSASLTWSRLVCTIYVLCVSLISVIFSCPHAYHWSCMRDFFFCGLIMYETMRLCILHAWWQWITENCFYFTRLLVLSKLYATLPYVCSESKRVCLQGPNDCHPRRFLQSSHARSG